MLNRADRDMSSGQVHCPHSVHTVHTWHCPLQSVSPKNVLYRKTANWKDKIVKTYLSKTLEQFDIWTRLTHTAKFHSQTSDIKGSLAAISQWSSIVSPYRRWLRDWRKHITRLFLRSVSRVLQRRPSTSHLMPLDGRGGLRRLRGTQNDQMLSIAAVCMGAGRHWARQRTAR